MKTAFIFFSVLFFFSPLHSQQFHSLDGIESLTGQTILLYRLGTEQYHSNPIFKFNLQTGYEQQIMDAHEIYFPVGADIKTVNDFEFFPGDTTNFMNVEDRIYMDYGSYIAINDNSVLGYFSPLYGVDISKQDAQKVFVFDGGGPVRSWDGGYTFPLDSIYPVTNFIPIALADFDDEVMFGFDEELDFCKNGGVVDTAYVGFDIYWKLLYDVNQFHVYRVNWTYGGYSLNVSNNKGDAFTWTKTYQSENPIYVTIDSTQSGVVFLADGRKIYKSINNGYTFFEFKSLPSKLIGIYKKPNSEIIYAASKNMIFKVTPDSITIIKSLPIPDDAFEWFPLAIGNVWAYDSYLLEGISNQFTGTKYMSVTKDTVIQSKKYFVVENNFYFAAVFHRKMYLRVDSATGFIYRYWEELSEEFIFHNLCAEVGDVIQYPRNPDEPYYFLDYEQPMNYLGIDTYERMYSENGLCTCHHTLIKGFGLGTTFFIEFTGEENILKGCVINGVLYGDTTFVVDVEDEQNPIPTEYKLEQNYPNPFNSSSVIKYSVPHSSQVVVKVFDVLGNEIETLVNEEKPTGTYELNWNAANLPSGVYFYRLQAGEFVETRKMILLK